MTNVIKFPHAETRNDQSVAKPAAETSPVQNKNLLRRTGHALLNTLYFLFIMLWTPLRIVLALNVVWQFGKMLYHWNDGALAAMLPFVVSFALLTALTFLRANWKFRG